MTEIEEIFDHIHNGRNFLLSGGAGSGKTYTLVEVIKRVIEENPSAMIACMTYTNAAVKEIEERVGHEHLYVTTIHDFLWDQIKHFQKELKLCLVELANEEEIKVIKLDGVDPVPNDYFDNLEDGIQYKEYSRISQGVISHDEVIALSDRVFERYPKLGDMVKDKFKFIFVDEYQDTQIDVVRIFLEHFKLTEKRNIIGFFGDAMQSIYDKRIGRLDDYRGTEEGQVREVQKRQNRRNPKLIYELANKLRTDGLVQIHSTDNSAPNMTEGKVKEGEITFLYSASGDIDNVKAHLAWDFTNSKETKELNLTHNLIANKASFQTLMDIYDKDKILEYKKRIKDHIKNHPVEWDPSKMTFGEVVERLKEGKTGKGLKMVEPAPKQQDFIKKNKNLYKVAMDMNFEVFSKVYVDKDQLLDDKKQDENDLNKKGSKRDNLIRHLYRLQEIIWLYQNERYYEFLKATDYKGKLGRVSEKRNLKNKIDSLVNVGEKTIEEVIQEANDYGICLIDDKLKRFAENQKYVYDQVIKVPFKELQALYEYLEGRTPFSTQHKTKGTEFDNVLVILDNGGWNNYNFEYLFTNRTDKASVLERSRKIFYVCCTRAKERLAVYYCDPSQAVIDKAIDWFGRENVVNLGETH
ncbi:UvrD-helicase domain-containing protein [Croceimicrobium hydrocarbonivorans]|uniref:ATP-dependent helicase n=1 Tax=Croceimicrobium hydrocarbonivorans TaxID=2761580 RepID=A0A7H0VEL0_9FLAO|nr:ATP-dependent helicase [Croceimicrobium hydrocarbonivorans]QNR24158.1 ATP-dependent helicase [Croceimicrobium hydrocarbonivorans]